MIECPDKCCLSREYVTPFSSRDAVLNASLPWAAFGSVLTREGVGNVRTYYLTLDGTDMHTYTHACIHNCVRNACSHTLHIQKGHTNAHVRWYASTSCTYTQPTNTYSATLGTLRF